MPSVGSYSVAVLNIFSATPSSVASFSKFTAAQ